MRKGLIQIAINLVFKKAGACLPFVEHVIASPMICKKVIEFVLTPYVLRKQRRSRTQNSRQISWRGLASGGGPLSSEKIDDILLHIAQGGKSIDISLAIKKTVKD